MVSLIFAHNLLNKEHPDNFCKFSDINPIASKENKKSSEKHEKGVLRNPAKEVIKEQFFILTIFHTALCMG